MTSVAQVQLAINFARSLNLRLSVKNTGHDFNAKSVGAGSLSVWTHHLNSIQYLGPNFALGSHAGPALKIGAGVEVLQAYEYADNLGLEVVGGIGRVSAAIRLLNMPCRTNTSVSLDSWPRWWLYPRRRPLPALVEVRDGR